MLAIANLRKTYGNFVALDGLDLSIASGEILALLGPNGAGKSTTVKCLVGLLKPDQGSVQIDGADALTDASVRRLVGYLPEVARLHETLTPWEFLLLKGRLFDLDDAVIADRSERIPARLRHSRPQRRADGRVQQGHAAEGFDLSCAANRPEAVGV